MQLLRNLLQLFDRRERWQLVGLMALVFIGSVLEVVGIGILLPFLKLVGDPALALQHEQIGPWLRRLGIGEADALIVWTSIAMLLFLVFKGGYLLLATWVTYAFSYRKYLTLTRQLFAAYLHAPYPFHLRNNTAGLVRNVTVEADYVCGILKYMIQLPAELVVVLGIVVLLLATQPGATLGGIVLLGAVSWGLTSFARHRLGRYGRIRSEQHGRMIQWVNQGLGGVKEVKVAGRETFFVEALEQSGSLYTAALARSTFLGQYPRLVIETVAGLTLVGLVLALVLTKGNLQDLLPVLALFGIALVRLIPSVSRILSAINTIRFHATSVRVVLQSLREAAGPASRSGADAQRASTPVPLGQSITLNQLAYAYPDSAGTAVTNVSLTIKRGQQVAFVGSSGAGKTTLVNMVLGLLEPTAGRILVDGRDISENLAGWQRQIGYIPQDIYLLDDTIRRNVAFGIPDAEIEDAAVWRALEAAQLASLLRELPKGLDTPMGERGARLSAGQRQRIGIARALYHDPEVLVLDEATSALDNETERLFSSALYRLPGSKTIIIIAHRLSTVRHCDRIFLMHEGRLVDSGTYDALLAGNSIFQRLQATSPSPSIHADLRAK